MAAAHHARGIWRQPQQVFQCRARPPPRPQLQHLSEQHEHHDDDCGVEVGFHHAVHTEARGKRLRQDRPGDAEEVGRAHAERDQREHVRVAADDRVPAALEEWPRRPQHHGRAEDQPDPVRHGHVDAAAESHAQQHVPHRQREHWQRQRRCDPEPARHVHEFGIRPLVDEHRAWLERHPADRARTRAVAHDLRMHRAGVFS